MFKMALVPYDRNALARVAEAKSKLQAEQKSIAAKKTQLQAAEKATIAQEQTLATKILELDNQKKAFETESAATLRALEERKLQLYIYSYTHYCNNFSSRTTNICFNETVTI
jgi:septal ring factor EnvC (AmiA/AmiB activator)